MSCAIVHLDGDAFFAAVEQAADPRLRGKPVAVGGERRGVITSASYEARKFGVKAAMPTVQARKLCPRLIIIPGDFERYEQFSRIMFSYAEDHTPLVEVQGLDDGYYDLTRNRAKPPAEIEPEFFAAASARGHPAEETQELWNLITSFQGNAFNKAHSTAYGVEAYEAAWIKSRYPAEFLAGLLTNGKGFYSTLVFIVRRQLNFPG